jgi:ATP-binding cassette subfamily B protein RaxB
MTYQMIGNLVRHLLRLPSDFFEKRPRGRHHLRVGSAPDPGRADAGVVAALIDGCMAPIAGAILFIYSPTWLRGVRRVRSTCSIAFVLFPPCAGGRRSRSSSRAKEQSHLMETVRAARPSRSWGARPSVKAAGATSTPA